MATNIRLLPLLRVVQSVGADEDWTLTLVFTAGDGVTPIDLTGVGFAATLSNGVSAIVVEGAVSGASNNVLTFQALAAAKSAWTPGYYDLTAVATDGADGIASDLIAESSLVVGAPRSLAVSPILAPGANATATVAAIDPVQLAGVFQALPTATQAAIAGALLAALPNLATGANGGAVPGTGLPYIDSSGFLALAQ